jgi:hypothetical protein
LNPVAESSSKVASAVVIGILPGRNAAGFQGTNVYVNDMYAMAVSREK